MPPLAKRTLPAFAALAAMCFLPARTQAATPESPANILLIIADDLNTWIGPTAGHPQARPPTLDLLATTFP